MKDLLSKAWKRPVSSAACTVLIGAIVSFEPLAHAQLTPGGGGIAPPPTQPDKPEGVARQAPVDPSILPTTPVLPPARSRQKKFQLFQLDGYFRLRGDWFKKLSMGFDDDPAAGGAPFPRSLGCQSEDVADSNPRSCGNSIRSSNIRLRLEPIVRITERTAVYAQIDVLDNLVLGSTPKGVFLDGSGRPGNVPVSGLADGQGAPRPGQNTGNSSIIVRRAWAEIDTSIGKLKFGRMPNHWGLGIVDNSGSKDPIHGKYDIDSDYGDTVDRVYLSTQIPGTKLNGAIAMDWNSTYPSSDILGVRNGVSQGGQPFDLDDGDDMDQWVFYISRMDSPKRFNERVAKGEIVANYGGYLAYRTQSFDPGEITFANGANPSRAVSRDLTIFMPNLWGRLAWGKLELEAEIAGAFGSIGAFEEDATAPGSGPKVSVRQLGGVAKASYDVLDGDLELDFQVGFASGGNFDNNPKGSLHFSDAVLLNASQRKITSFTFDPNYRVDLILFREILGAVRNATYLRPQATYNISPRISITGPGIFSIANKPVATPGNDDRYGIELNGDVSYEGESFFAGIAYGVLFPMEALDHPEDDPNAGGPGFGFGPDNTGSAQTAQTFQTRIGLRF